MSEISPPGAHHEEFTAWAKQQGVQVNGVGPAGISGYGLGIVAQRRIEVTKSSPLIENQPAECGGRLVKCFATCPPLRF